MTSYQSLPADEDSPVVVNNPPEPIAPYSIRRALILCTTLCLITLGAYKVGWFPFLQDFLFPDSTRTDLSSQQIPHLAPSEVPLAPAPSSTDVPTMASGGKYSVG